MALIGTLVSFSAETTIRSADVNSNFTAIRNAFNNSAVLNDTANTITVTHVFSVRQTFSLGILTSGTSTFGAGAVFDAGLTITSGQAVTASGVSITGLSALTLATTLTAGGGSVVVGHGTTAKVVIDGTDGAATAGQNSIYETGGNLGITSRGAIQLELDNDSNATQTVLSISASAGTTTLAAFRQDKLVSFGGVIDTEVAFKISNIPANVTGFSFAGYSLTGVNAQALMSLTGTWNTSGSPTALLLNVTNTTSGASSLLIDAQVASVSKFSVSKSGTVGYGLTANGSQAAGFTVNWTASGSIQTATLAASVVTIAFTGPAATGTILTLILYQDATGTRTVQWPATVIWPNGTAPTLTTTASRADILTFLYNGTNFAGMVSGQNFAAL